MIELSNFPMFSFSFFLSISSRRWRTLGMIQRWFSICTYRCQSFSSPSQCGKVKMRNVFAYLQIAQSCLHFKWWWWLKGFSFIDPLFFTGPIISCESSMNTQDLSHISHCVKVNLTMKTNTSWKPQLYFKPVKLLTQLLSTGGNSKSSYVHLFKYWRTFWVF